MKAKLFFLLTVLFILSLSGCAAEKTTDGEGAAEKTAHGDGSAEKITHGEGAAEKAPQGDGATEENTLWDTAAPQNSALSFYIYDGEKTTRQFLFPADSIRGLLSDLSTVNATPAEDWSPELITLPVYGLLIMDTGGHPLEAAWSNGYLVMGDGSAYHFDYDFSGLTDAYAFESPDTWNTATILPSAEYLFKDESGWHTLLMREAKEPTPPEGINLEIDTVSDQTITTRFTNRTDQEWTYGEYYSAQVNIDGSWYDIPTASGMNWGFNSIAYVLPAGGEQSKTYSLIMYGDLPDGQYRIVTEGLSAEFFIVDGKPTVK